MSLERIESIEQRTAKVEEAVIKFGYIAETIVVQHDKRLTAVENDIDIIKASIYQTCDAKTKEIDGKIADAIKGVSANTDKLFKQAIGISVGMFGLFVGALAYLNMEHGRIYERINDIQSESVEHRTHISSILSTLTKMDDKIDDIHKNLHE